MLESIAYDLRFAIRHWTKSPGFTIAAALVIALGIGATTTVFSVADALLIRTPPGVREPESLLTMRVLDPHEKGPSLFSYAEFREVRDGLKGLSSVAALDVFRATVGHGDTGTGAEPEVVSGMMVSGNYFSILGTKPARGRFFRPDEDREGSPIPVVVVSYRYWTRRMGSDPAAIGRTITINRVPFTVIGVAEHGFQGHVAAYDFSLWIPIAMAGRVTPVDLTSRGYRGLSIIGRVSGSSLEEARAAVARIADGMRREHPREMEGRLITVGRYRKLIEDVRGPITVYMGLLFALAMTILGIASVNVGGMLLSRATSRTREMGIRLALGADRRALVRQLLVEYLLLFLLGGGLGALLSYWAMGVLETLHLPTPIPVALDLTVNGRVLSFALGAALLAGSVRACTGAPGDTDRHGIDARP